jgi:hypothetical protein
MSQFNIDNIILNYFKNKNNGFFVEVGVCVSEDTDTNNKVSCDTLENILLKNNVYSIDVEGYEKQVMDGIDVKKFDIKTIVIETHDKNKLPFIQYESTFEDFEYLCDIYNKEIISEYHILFTKK